MLGAFCIRTRRKVGDSAAQTIAQRREAIYPQELGTEQMTERIRGRKWMTIRERIFRRDCGLCQECQRNGRLKPGNQIDHIVALTNDGSNDDDNLEVICADCHDIKTNADLGHKPQVTTGLDGWPVASGANPSPVWRRQGYR